VPVSVAGEQYYKKIDDRAAGLPPDVDRLDDLAAVRTNTPGSDARFLGLGVREPPVV
jgi:hypothetical protein